MAQGTETVTLKLPSGEEVDVVVPAGMSDQEIHSLMQMKHPEMVAPPGVPSRAPVKGLDDVPPTPPAPDMFEPAGNRFMSGAKAGLGAENALNTRVDPEHPISTNPMIPGAGVYRDIKSGNVAGALGRIAGPAAELLPFAGGLRGKPAFERPVPEVPAPNTAPKFMAEPWSGERTGLPYQPNPRFAPAPAPAEPIPSRSGLMLTGKVEPPLGSPENPGIHSKIPLRVPRSVLEAERAAAQPAPTLAPLGSPENPGPYAKLPMRVPREVLNEEAEARAASRGAETNRDATLTRTNIPEFAGEGEAEEGISPARISEYGSPRARGRMSPPLRPLVGTPEDWQTYDAQKAILRPEAQDAGMYSAARGAVRRIPDYQERIGRSLRQFGQPVNLMEEESLPPKKAGNE